ncbi:MarR family winged helix-turn-helix transcriptional regulator [Paenibacillus segetis]|uniref:MarR family transcriptional regulator n=1 Tax=Paenibacillus segetis TaxID=1325360 RepID=A0ABQ1YET1_9BACL|nr:MarR family transcriptional regulator [Paenibacillus segetis]GGH22058.1 MarR family transcriptional regulator [Paenibacillus segetis]
MNKNEVLFEVSSNFRAIVKGISKEWNKRGEFSLSFAQFKALYKLNQHGSQKVSQLAESLSITPAAATGVTDRLLAEGYVKRERAHDDRRIVYITITEKGEEIIQKVTESQKEAIHHFFDVLPEEDIEHLRRIFNKILSTIDHLD